MNKRGEKQEPNDMTKRSQGSNGEKMQRREEIQWVVKNSQRKLEKTPWLTSIYYTSKSTENLPTPTLHSISIYEMRIYLVTKKEGYKGERNKDTYERRRLENTGRRKMRGSTEWRQDGS